MMMTTRNGKIILGLALVFLMAGASSGFAEGIKIFSGKISEIARGTELDIAKKGTFYVLRLKEHPSIEFRLSTGDAVKFGVIEAAGSTGVMTPKQTKGLGWKVKLTCDGKNLGLVKAPVYQVVSLQRLSD
jgi:hypothetical protein